MDVTKCGINIQDIICKCRPCNIYGGYCKRHRTTYLLKDNLILIDRFTYNIKDYNLKDLKYFYIQNIRDKHSNFKKQDYYNSIIDFTIKDKLYINEIYKIIKLQSLIRKNQVLSKIRYQGSIFNRWICNNEEDFYTYDSKYDIESKFYFSYKDLHGKSWCFDIRSLKRLIDMNYSNPYTMEDIPLSIKIKVDQYLDYLKKHNIDVRFNNTVITDRNILVKQKLVDLFSQIEYSGYSCDINWILDLTINKIKKLYKELEDIWNYRAGLSTNIKKRIAPPDGRMFVMPVSDYYNCNTLLELQEILLHELSKVLRSTNNSDMNLGFMYIIIGLSLVSRECLMTHSSWVTYSLS
jgi:hypothetical protein